MQISIKQKRIIKISVASILFVSLGLVIPETGRIPVMGASTNDWNHDTFWYEPWGESGVHKGIDIFAKEGALAQSPESGLVVFNGQLKLGGNVVLVLGPKWRLHYFAHLEHSTVSLFNWVTAGEPIGVVGKTGNAQDRPSHLHYSIVSLIPRPWEMDSSAQGWKKAFYVNPDQYLRSNSKSSKELKTALRAP